MNVTEETLGRGLGTAAHTDNSAIMNCSTHFPSSLILNSFPHAHFLLPISSIVNWYIIIIISNNPKNISGEHWISWWPLLSCIQAQRRWSPRLSSEGEDLVQVPCIHSSSKGKREGCELQWRPGQPREHPWRPDDRLQELGSEHAPGATSLLVMMSEKLKPSPVISQWVPLWVEPLQAALENYKMNWISNCSYLLCYVLL